MGNVFQLMVWNKKIPNTTFNIRNAFQVVCLTMSTQVQWKNDVIFYKSFHVNLSEFNKFQGLWGHNHQ